jgi:hypothetical protein
MPVMKKTILYSLFIVSSISYSLHSQDANIQDSEDLILVFDDGYAEEIYPLEDTDTICLMPEIQNYIEDLEFDPTVKIEDFEFDSVAKNDLQEFTDLAVLPQATEDIVALYDNASEQESLDTIVCQLDEKQIIHCQSANIDNPELVKSSQQDEEYPINMINQDQLEAILNTHNEQFDRYLDDALSSESSNDDERMTISIDDLEMMMASENGILLHNDEISPTQQTESSITETEDDDIVPVPHDLINSVKKANKQKKKLEKLERKEKANFFKKSKKKK